MNRKRGIVEAFPYWFSRTEYREIVKAATDKVKRLCEKQILALFHGAMKCMPNPLEPTITGCFDVKKEIKMERSDFLPVYFALQIRHYEQEI